jgi:hypothetical protein
LWEEDGPTKALQQYMLLYQFNKPDTWDGFRDIDEKIPYEELRLKIQESL